MEDSKNKLTIKKPKSGVMSAFEGPTPTPLTQAKKGTDKGTIVKTVGIKQSTANRLQEIATEAELTPNAIMRLAMEYFVAQYESGEAKTYITSRTKTVKTVID